MEMLGASSAAAPAAGITIACTYVSGATDMITVDSDAMVCDLQKAIAVQKGTYAWWVDIVVGTEVIDDISPVCVLPSEVDVVIVNRACGRGCTLDYDIRCRCEPNCPNKNSTEQLLLCPVRHTTIASFMTNTSEVHDFMDSYNAGKMGNVQSVIHAVQMLGAPIEAEDAKQIWVEYRRDRFGVDSDASDDDHYDDESDKENSDKGSQTFEPCVPCMPEAASSSDVFLGKTLTS
jgi:hypothetical protein